MQRTQWKMAGQLGFDTGIILGILCYSWSIENNARMMGIFSHKENNNIKTLIFSCMYKYETLFFKGLIATFKAWLHRCIIMPGCKLIREYILTMLESSTEIIGILSAFEFICHYFLKVNL